MRQIFVDTSAWDAIADSGDPNHDVALLFRDEIAGQCRLVVTNYILDEVYTLLLMNVGYQRTVDFKINSTSWWRKVFLKSSGFQRTSPVRRGLCSNDSTWTSNGHLQTASHTW